MMTRNRERVYIKAVACCLLLFVCGLQHTWAQAVAEKRQKAAQSFLVQAEAAKNEGNFAKAEALYRRSLAMDGKKAKASYNLSHLYAHKNLETEAVKRLLQTAKNAENETLKHKAYHNLGNAFMAQKDYRQAVEAYKDALRNDPTDDQTRYNLALAKKKLKQQGNKDKNKKDKKKKKKKKKKQDNKNKSDKNKKKNEKKNNKKKSGGKKKQKDKQNQNRQKKNHDQNNKPRQQQKKQSEQHKKQQQKSDLSDKQAENLLRAIQNSEKKVQEKRKKQKAKKAAQHPNEKYW